MGGGYEGSPGRSHRRNSAGTSPSQIRQEQQPNPVEPPRWFTARRKLVKFKSAFKTGLARCPAPPGAATAGKRYRRAPTGVYRSNILGKLWMDFPPQATACVLSSLARATSLAPRVPYQRGGSRATLRTKLSQRWSVKIPGGTLRRYRGRPLFLRNSKLP